MPSPKRRNERMAEIHAERRAAGLCVDCATPAVGLRCPACEIRNAATRMAYRERCRAEGLCYTCGKPRRTSGTATSCRECADRRNAAARAKRRQP
jgi:hypothetical protein